MQTVLFFNSIFIYRIFVHHLTTASTTHLIVNVVGAYPQQGVNNGRRQHFIYRATVKERYQPRFRMRLIVSSRKELL